MSRKKSDAESLETLATLPESTIEVNGKKEVETLQEDLKNVKKEINGKLDVFSDAIPIETSLLITEEPKEDVADKVPTLSEVGWEAYVMKHFEGNELEKGRPKVVGLRRVAKLLLGSILKSKARVRQTPTPDNGERATVEYTVRIFQTKNLEVSEPAHVVEYTDAADAWPPNIPGGKEFAQYPVAMATTRAEGRALRKLLNLGTPAAEEVNDEEDDKSPINRGQITVIDLKCEELGIDVWKYLRSGQVKYKEIEEIPYKVATKMCSRLGEYHRGFKVDKDGKKIPVEIPNEIKGFNPNWRDEK